MDSVFQLVESDDRDRLKRLLTADPTQVMSTNNNGNTPLHEAVRFSRPGIASILLKAKADPNALGELDNTPLHFAVERHALPELVGLLIESGANLEEVNALGETPLYKAAFGNPELADVLLHHGAYFDLNSAILLKRFDRVRQLLQEDPRLSRVIFPGQLMMNAVLVRSKELVRFLLEHGIAPDDPSLFLTIQQTLNEPAEDLDMLRVLLKAGANMLARDSYGNTLIESARRWDNEQAQHVIDLLREYGAKESSL